VLRIKSPLSSLPTHWLVAGSSWLSRGIIILVRIVTVPLLLNYLGVDQYAIYATLISLEGWFLLTDFGVGASLQNYLSEARARNEDPQKLISSVAQLSILAFLFFMILLFLLSRHSEAFLFSDATLGANRGKAFLFTGILYVMVAIGSTGYRALNAMQKGYWMPTFQAIANILALVSILLLLKGYEGEYKLF
jgi:O-antigen/teichoic acid export membrane protein